ncbi:MAG: hypothetical protein AUJ57_10445 [Zetaproteobacteria bacterium CG1_02_53_45]|nr:MAG: hypothetical protein AUJ57_10445 [Zetaproteobacteria bacterium CG1_02_53_45]
MHTQTMQHSRFNRSYTVTDTDLNHYGTIHGGRLLTLCDETAYCAAKKLTRHICLTRAVHRARFHRAAHQDEKVTISAVVGLTGNTSLWVAVEVTSVVQKACIMDAVFVFAAVNVNRQPQQVVKVLAESPEETMLQEQLVALRNQVLSNP